MSDVTELEHCPLCDERLESPCMMDHVFYGHLRRLKIGYITCWCMIDYPRDWRGLGMWADHIGQRGGLAAHWLAHILGVDDG